MWLLLLYNNNVEFIVQDFPNEILLDEIHSSFDEAFLSTIRDEKATKELLPATKLKYTVAVNEWVNILVINFLFYSITS